MFSSLLRRSVPAARNVFGGGRVGYAVSFGLAAVVAAASLETPALSDSASTHKSVEETLKIVKKIQADLGIPDDSAAVVAKKAPKYTAAANYPNWTKEHHSLTSKYTTPAVYEKYYGVTTPNGFTIDQVIAPAVDLPYAKVVHIGCVAGDAESYTVFADLFDPIIEEYHGYAKDAVHPTDLDYTKLKVPALDSKYILSTRIRAGRSLAGLPLPPAASRAARRETESLIVQGLNSLQGELSGKYYGLLSMTEEENESLIKQHFLFENPDAWTISGGFGRDWPDCRGIYLNTNKTFLVWVNEEDHMRIISMQKGADFVAVFKRFVDACNAIEASLKANGVSFAHSAHLGYITTCPTNLGTGLRASVHVKLPLLGKVAGFDKYAKGLGLQVRGQGGEKDYAYTGVFDVSNRHRLGYSEVQLVQTMLDGIEKLIELEKKLEAGETVTL